MRELLKELLREDSSEKRPHLISLPGSELMATDFEVLEYSTPDTVLAKGDKAFEKYWSKEIPKWAYKEGINLTTDFDNACGYGNWVFGVVLVNTEVFEPSDVHFQARNPEGVIVVGIWDESLRKVIWGDEEAFEDAEGYRGTANKAEVREVLKTAGIVLPDFSEKSKREK